MAVEKRTINGLEVGFNTETNSYCNLPIETVKAEKSVSQMNLAELAAKAAELGVDISGAKNNPERAKIITDFIAQQEQGNE